jgi:hypothetical protein
MLSKLNCGAQRAKVGESINGGNILTDILTNRDFSSNLPIVEAEEEFYFLIAPDTFDPPTY